MIENCRRRFDADRSRANGGRERGGLFTLRRTLLLGVGVYLLGKTGRGYWTCFYSILSNSAPESKPGGCYHNLLNNNWFFLNPKNESTAIKIRANRHTGEKGEKSHELTLSVRGVERRITRRGGCCSLAAKWIQMNDVEERGQRVTSCSTSRRCLGQTLSKLAHRVRPLRVVHNVIHSQTHTRFEIIPRSIYRLSLLLIRV